LHHSYHTVRLEGEAKPVPQRGASARRGRLPHAL